MATESLLNPDALDEAVGHTSLPSEEAAILDEDVSTPAPEEPNDDDNEPDEVEPQKESDSSAETEELQSSSPTDTANNLGALLEEKAQSKGWSSIVLGRYKVLDIIGRGAFSVVYRASQVGIGRIVALKVFRLHKSTRSNSELAETALSRFQREARLASMLRHPNTITLFDYDKTDQGIVYMAFEFIDGPTLTELIKSNPSGLPVERVIRIARQIAESLQEAHETGIIHRDLKPGNIMLMNSAKIEDYVKVLDFGIAKMVEGSSADPDHIPDHSDELALLDIENIDSSESAELTHDGKIVGTPRYIPPEQIHGRNLTGAADLYSLGLIMHEMLTGVPANPGKSAGELIKWHLRGNTMQAPEGFSMPPGLHQVITRSTSKVVAKRYADCNAFLEELNALDASGDWLKEPPERKSPWPLILAVNVIVVMVIIAFGAIWLSNNTSAVQNDTNTAITQPPQRDTQPTPVPSKTTPVLQEEPPKETAPKPEGTQNTPTNETKPDNEQPPPAETKETVVEVVTEPKGVTAFIDGKVVGTTPFKLAIRDDQKEIIVTLRKTGYTTARAEWKQGEAPPFPVALKRRATPNKTNTKTKPKPNGAGKPTNNKYRILK